MCKISIVASSVAASSATCQTAIHWADLGRTRLTFLVGYHAMSEFNQLQLGEAARWTHRCGHATGIGGAGVARVGSGGPFG